MPFPRVLIRKGTQIFYKTNLTQLVHSKRVLFQRRYPRGQTLANIKIQNHI